MKTSRLVALVSLALCQASSAYSDTAVWVHQFGTDAADRSQGISADGLGNVYISGSTHGSLVGDKFGLTDAFVAKYDAGGTQQWIRQLGNHTNDFSNGVSADGLGNVYISGSTGRHLGGVSAGGNDAFLFKYDTSGNAPVVPPTWHQRR